MKTCSTRGIAQATSLCVSYFYRAALCDWEPLCSSYGISFVPFLFCPISELSCLPRLTGHHAALCLFMAAYSPFSKHSKRNGSMSEPQTFSSSIFFGIATSWLLFQCSRVALAVPGSFHRCPWMQFTGVDFRPTSEPYISVLEHCITAVCHCFNVPWWLLLCQDPCTERGKSSRRTALI